MVIPTEVGAEATAAMDDALLLRAWSITWRPILGLRSCPA
jgi:hypothetical protein